MAATPLLKAVKTNQACSLAFVRHILAFVEHILQKHTFYLLSQCFPLYHSVHLQSYASDDSESR